MENQTDYSTLSNMFSKYYNDKEKDKGSSSNSSEDRLSDYFNPRTGVEVFRTLPRNGNQQLWDEAFFHEIEVNDPTNKRARNGKIKRKFYCLSKNNPKVPKLDEKGDKILTSEGKPVLIKQRCPLCEKQEAILAKQDPSVKGIKKENITTEQKPIFDQNVKLLKESNTYQARKFFILKGIDKGQPKDGIKFWRIKEHYKNQGVMDKIIPVYQNFLSEFKKNPADAYEGCDLKLTMGEDSYMGNTYPVVSSVIGSSPKRLHEDDAVINQWLNDTKTWRDVYKEPSMAKLNPFEYLERVAKGTDPYWDESDVNNKKYIFPDPADAELQQRANDKSKSLKSDDDDEEMASDLAYNSKSINQNLSNEDVGSYNGGGSSIADDFKSDSGATSETANNPQGSEITPPNSNPPKQDSQESNVGQQPVESQPQQNTAEQSQDNESNQPSDDNGEFDDLPF